MDGRLGEGTFDAKGGDALVYGVESVFYRSIGQKGYGRLESWCTPICTSFPLRWVSRLLGHDRLADSPWGEGRQREGVTVSHGGCGGEQ